MWMVSVICKAATDMRTIELLLLNIQKLSSYKSGLILTFVYNIVSNIKNDYLM